MTDTDLVFEGSVLTEDGIGRHRVLVHEGRIAAVEPLTDSIAISAARSAGAAGSSAATRSVIVRPPSLGAWGCFYGGGRNIHNQTGWR